MSGRRHCPFHSYLSELTISTFTLLSQSLVDQSGLKAVNDSAMTVVKCIQEGRWSDATEAWGQTQEVIENATNGVNFYNILKWGGTEPSALFAGTCYCILILLKEHKVLLIATVMILSFQIARLGQISQTQVRLFLMHQSFVAPAPSGPRNSGAFNFSIFKALHCRAKVVKSPLKAPAPGG